MKKFKGWLKLVHQLDVRKRDNLEKEIKLHFAMKYRHFCECFGTFRKVFSSYDIMVEYDKILMTRLNKSPLD